MKKIILFVIIISGLLFPQTIYDVTPGTKGNRIIISIENESEICEARNVEVKLTNSPPQLIFNHISQLIKIINGSEKKDASFSFDIKRNVGSNKKDTIEFSIKGNGISLKKSFIIYYSAPKEYSLSQNFPNPFNPITTIRYDLPFDSKVSLKIYDILGKEVKKLVEKEQSAGYKEIDFNGSSFASGIYIYRLIANNPANNKNFVSIKKMMMIK